MTSPDRQAAPPAEVMQELILAAWISQGITAVADLGVADALAGGPLSINELAGKVGAEPDALGRLLRALISKGIFARRDDGRYELSPLADLLRSDVPVSMAPMARFSGARQHREHWSLLTEAIKTGTIVVPALRGESFFDYLGDEPEFGQIFNDAMTGQSGLSVGPVVDAYDFTRFGTIVDVAGGHGRLLAAILASAPDAQGVLYDLPEVIAGAPALLRESVSHNGFSLPRDRFSTASRPVATPTSSSTSSMTGTTTRRRGSCAMYGPPPPPAPRCCSSRRSSPKTTVDPLPSGRTWRC